MTLKRGLSNSWMYVFAQPFAKNHFIPRVGYLIYLSATTSAARFDPTFEKTRKRLNESENEEQHTENVNEKYFSNRQSLVFFIYIFCFSAIPHFHFLFTRFLVLTANRSYFQHDQRVCCSENPQYQLLLVTLGIKNSYNSFHHCLLVNDLEKYKLIGYFFLRFQSAELFDYLLHFAFTFFLI